MSVFIVGLAMPRPCTSSLLFAANKLQYGNIRRLERFVWFALLRLSHGKRDNGGHLHCAQIYRWTTRRRLTSISLAAAAQRESERARSFAAGTQFLSLLTSISLVARVHFRTSSSELRTSTLPPIRIYIHGWHFSVSEKPIWLRF